MISQLTFPHDPPPPSISSPLSLSLSLPLTLSFYPSSSPSLSISPEVKRQKSVPEDLMSSGDERGSLLLESDLLRPFEEEVLRFDYYGYGDSRINLLFIPLYFFNDYLTYR